MVFSIDCHDTFLKALGYLKPSFWDKCRGEWKMEPAPVGSIAVIHDHGNILGFKEVTGHSILANGKVVYDWKDVDPPDMELEIPRGKGMRNPVKYIA